MVIEGVLVSVTDVSMAVDQSDNQYPRFDGRKPQFRFLSCFFR